MADDQLRAGTGPDVPQGFHYDESGRVVPFEEDPPLPPPRAVEPYCWEDGGDEDAPLTKRLAHTLHWGGANALAGMEFVGEVFAEFFGLTQSQYQWAIDAHERQLQHDKEKRRDAAQRAAMEREEALAADSKAVEASGLGRV